MNLRCLIVDDEPLALDVLEEYISRTPQVQLAGKCYDGMEALQFIKQEKVDVIFLDINMPLLSGMELVNLLPRNLQVIFTTAYAEFAVESYEKNSVDYLLKPITFERFLQATNKLKVDTANDTTPHPAVSLFIKSGKKIIQVNAFDITHIEGMRDYAVIHHGNEKIMVSKTLKDLEAILPWNFIRIHFSFFVNLDRITKIEDNHVHAGSANVPISNKYRDDFMQIIKSKIL